MMTACGAEELTPSLPFSAAGTGRWHSLHSGPVRGSCSGARTRSAGVGGAYGSMGGRRGRHAPAPGSSPCRARPGWVGTDCFRVCVRLGGCHVSLPFPNAVGRRPRCVLLWPARGPSWADCWAVANDGISFVRGPRGLPSIKVDSHTDPSPSNIYPATGKLRGLDRK